MAKVARTDQVNGEPGLRDQASTTKVCDLCVADIEPETWTSGSDRTRVRPRAHANVRFLAGASARVPDVEPAHPSLSTRLWACKEI
jgi:hypothetical protein